MERKLLSCVAIVLALVVTVKPSSAAVCAPGQGIKKFDLLSAVSGLLGGGAPRSGPTCQPCRFGTASAGGQDAECQMCTPFVSAPNFLRTSCDCLPGSYLASRPESWTTCLPYSYANSDHTSCECAAGYYTNNADAKAVVCRQCPEGTYKASTGNGNATACLACPAGLTSSGSRRSCEKAANGSCTQCAETHFNHMRDGKCQQCPNNTLANPGRTLCDMCAHGALQTSQPGEDLSCMACMFGFKKDDHTNACVEDPHAKLETDPHNPTLPTHHGEHPVEAIPTPTNPSLPGAGAATEPVETKPEVQPPAGITTVRTTPGQGSTNMLKLAVSPSSGAATLSTVKTPVAPARRFALGGSSRIA
eukprot:gene4261-4512_t